MDELFVVLLLIATFAILASDRVRVAAKFKLLFGCLLLLAICWAVLSVFFMVEEALPPWSRTPVDALMMAGILWMAMSPYFPGFRAYYEQGNPEFFTNHDQQRQSRKFRVYMAVGWGVFVLLIGLTL